MSTTTNSGDDGDAVSMPMNGAIGARTPAELRPVTSPQTTMPPRRVRAAAMVPNDTERRILHPFPHAGDHGFLLLRVELDRHAGLDRRAGRRFRQGAVGRLQRDREVRGIALNAAGQQHAERDDDFLQSGWRSSDGIFFAGIRAAASWRHDPSDAVRRHESRGRAG